MSCVGAWWGHGHLLDPRGRSRADGREHVVDLRLEGRTRHPARTVVRVVHVVVATLHTWAGWVRAGTRTSSAYTHSSAFEIIAGSRYDGHLDVSDAGLAREGRRCVAAPLRLAAAGGAIGPVIGRRSRDAPVDDGGAGARATSAMRTCTLVRFACSSRHARHARGTDTTRQPRRRPGRRCREWLE